MADVSHASRSHATWSASASDRRWACPGSLALEMEAPFGDKESEAAAWGTACHEVAEKALRSGKDCVAYLGETVATKAHKIDVDDEVCETAQVYVDYVRHVVAFTGDKDSPSRLLTEQKFSLESLDPPFEAGGTGDAVILYGYGDTIEIVDLKGGRGVVVEALGNKQLRTYGLGAVLANPGDWKRVKVTIVQPRAPHADGRIRSEEFDFMDLFDWTVDLIDAMEAAEGARTMRAVIGKLAVVTGWTTVGEVRIQKEEMFSEAMWAGQYLNPGSHCTFCKASATCPALQRKALETAKTYFDDETQTMTAPPAPETLGVEQIVRVLDAADMIGNWLNAVRSHAQSLAEMGVPVTDGNSTYGLTAKRTTRKWKDEEQIVAALSLRTDRDAEEFYQVPKIMSPAMVEKLLGKKGYEGVKDLVVQESSGFNLTRIDKTTRGVIEAPAKTFFQPE